MSEYCPQPLTCRILWLCSEADLDPVASPISTGLKRARPTCCCPASRGGPGFGLGTPHRACDTGLFAMFREFTPARFWLRLSSDPTERNSCTSPHPGPYLLLVLPVATRALVHAAFFFSSRLEDLPQTARHHPDNAQTPGWAGTLEILKSDPLPPGLHPSRPSHACYSAFSTFGSFDTA
jgi:hypothetical protein